MASAAESMNISRQTAHKWWRRYQEAGELGLVDRSSRPRRCPTKTSAKVERRVVALRQRHQLGPARLAERASIADPHRTWQAHVTDGLEAVGEEGDQDVVAHVALDLERVAGAEIPHRMYAPEARAARMARRRRAAG